MGITPVLGTLDDRAVLIQHAKSCDAIINAASSDHRRAIETFIKVLSGTGKTLIGTSG